MVTGWFSNYFVSEIDSNAEIFIINADGFNIGNITNHFAPDGGPVWYPSDSVNVDDINEKANHLSEKKPREE